MKNLRFWAYWAAVLYSYGYLGILYIAPSPITICNIVTSVCLFLMSAMFFTNDSMKDMSDKGVMAFFIFFSFFAIFEILVIIGVAFLN